MDESTGNARRTPAGGGSYDRAVAAWAGGGYRVITTAVDGVVSISTMAARAMRVAGLPLNELHRALAAVSAVVPVPAVRADVLVDVDPHAISLPEALSAGFDCVIGEIDAADGLDAQRMTLVLGHLLDPLIDAVRIGGARRTVVRRLVAGSLARRWSALGPGAAAWPDGWFEQVLGAAGYPVAPTRSV